MINIKGLSVYLVCAQFFRHKLDEIFAKILKRDDKILEKISFRTKYYNQISQNFSALLNANRGGAGSTLTNSRFTKFHTNLTHIKSANILATNCFHKEIWRYK